MLWLQPTFPLFWWLWQCMVHKTFVNTLQTGHACLVLIPYTFHRRQGRIWTSIQTRICRGSIISSIHFRSFWMSLLHAFFGRCWIQTLSSFIKINYQYCSSSGPCTPFQCWHACVTHTWRTVCCRYRFSDHWSWLASYTSVLILHRRKFSVSRYISSWNGTTSIARAYLWQDLSGRSVWST